MTKQIMDNNQLFRAVVNSQASMKAELLTKISSVEKSLGTKIEKLEKETKKGFIEVNKRVDKLGLSLARLEDDTPTNKDFDNLVDRVTKLENNIFVTA